MLARLLACLLLLAPAATWAAPPSLPSEAEAEHMLDEILRSGTTGSPDLQAALKSAVKALYTGDAESGRLQVLNLYKQNFHENRDRTAQKAIESLSSACQRMAESRRALSSRLFYQDFEILERGVVGGPLIVIDRLKGEFLSALMELNHALGKVPAGLGARTESYGKALDSARDWARKTCYGGHPILDEDAALLLR